MTEKIRTCRRTKSQDESVRPNVINSVPRKTPGRNSNANRKTLKESRNSSDRKLKKSKKGSSRISARPTRGARKSVRPKTGGARKTHRDVKTRLKHLKNARLSRNVTNASRSG